MWIEAQSGNLVNLSRVVRIVCVASNVWRVVAMTEDGEGIELFASEEKEQAREYLKRIKTDLIPF